MKYTVILEQEKAWSPRLWAEIIADNIHEADMQAKDIAAAKGHYAWSLLEGHDLNIDLDKYQVEAN